jgi:hypothetical protein
VNAIGGGALDIYQTSNGADPLVNPVLLILGVPNDIGSALAGGSITGAQLFAPYPGVATATLQMGFGTSAYGLNGSGYQGAMTATNEI